MNNKTAPTDFTIPLNQLRDQIDQIDQKILLALSERFALVREVSAQKIQSGIVFRPRREQQKHQQLIKFAKEYQLPEKLLFQLWRIIMSQSAFQQRAYTIALGNSDQRLLASEYFGFGVELQPFANNIEAIHAQQQNPMSVMALIDAADIQALSQFKESGHIVTVLSWNKANPPKAYLLANTPWDLEKNAELIIIWPNHTPIPENEFIIGKPYKMEQGALVHWKDQASHHSQKDLENHIQANFPQDTRLLGRIPNLL